MTPIDRLAALHDSPLKQGTPDYEAGWDDAIDTAIAAGVTLAATPAPLDVLRQNDHDEIAAMIHGRNDHQGSVCDDCNAMADYLMDGGVTLAATPAPLLCLMPDFDGDDCRFWAKTYGQEPCANCAKRYDLAATPAPLDGIAAQLARVETELEDCREANKIMREARATPDALDDQPLFDRIRELNAEVALLKKEAREDRAELRVALAATPAPLDVIAAVRKVFDSGARLKHKADDPTSSYDPLARETVVLAALRAALDGGPS